MELTARCAEFASTLAWKDLPDRAAQIVARSFADCIGVLLAGSSHPAVEKLWGVLGSSGQIDVLLGRHRAPADIAALVNSTAAHVLDFDDAALEGHVSAVLVPVILASAEETGASGKDMVAAYVAGFELWAELLARDADRHHVKGFHPTGIFGPIAAAAAACNLMRLDAGTTATALSIAASSAAGLVANFGTMTKSLHAGRAAQAGIQAARLARAGFDAAADALESPQGFLRAFSPSGRVDLERPCRLGEAWAITSLGPSLKLYPVCYAGHRIVDAALDVRGRLAAPLEEVARIVARVGRAQAVILSKTAPRQVSEARFSADFVVAAALVAGRVSLVELDEAFLPRPDLRALMRRVELHPTDERDPDEPLFAPADTVTLHLADGTTVEGAPVRHARGHPLNPVSDELLREKFLHCAAGRLDAAAARRLFDRLLALPEMAGVADIHAAARSSSDRICD